MHKGNQRFETLEDTREDGTLPNTRATMVAKVPIFQAYSSIRLEHRSHKARVLGSSPSRPTILYKIKEQNSYVTSAKTSEI